MRKYLIIAKNMWDEMLTYRVSFAIWRLRTILHTLIIYFLWIAILPPNKMIGSYNQSYMLTYVLGTSFISALVFSTRTWAISDEINQGTLSNLLIKPIHYFSYWFAKDIGDKAMNMVFFLAEIIVLFLLLRPPFFYQTNIIPLFFSVVSLTLSIGLVFFINLLIGFIAFWNPETWAIRFLYGILIDFFSGGLFPLDILPKPLFSFLQFTPLPYISFLPIKIYLGQISFFQIIFSIFISLFWLVVLYKIIQFVWASGLRVYTAEGQ